MTGRNSLTEGCHIQTPGPAALNEAVPKQKPAATTDNVEANIALQTLKQERDAALLAYQQSLKEVHHHAAKVVLIDMHYIEAMRRAHDQKIMSQDS